MSMPANGSYYIVNRETTDDGTLLAVTFNGTGAALTVTELGSQPTQVWLLSTYNSELQLVSPEDTGTSYVVGSDGNNLIVAPPSNRHDHWAIRGEDGIYTFQRIRFWSLKKAEVGQNVNYGAGSDTVTVLQNWRLISA